MNKSYYAVWHTTTTHQTIGTHMEKGTWRQMHGIKIPKDYRFSSPNSFSKKHQVSLELTKEKRESIPELGGLNQVKPYQLIMWINARFGSSWTSDLEQDLGRGKVNTKMWRLLDYGNIICSHGQEQSMNFHLLVRPSKMLWNERTKRPSTYPNIEQKPPDTMWQSWQNKMWFV